MTTVYAPGALAAGVSGVTLVHGIVNHLGLLHDVRVVRSLNPDLDAEAVKAFAQWRFRPATRDGVVVAVPVTADVTFTFRRR